MLYSDRVRAANETRDCPDGLCPRFRFTLLGGTAEDADCRPRLFSADDYKIEPPVTSEFIYL